MAGEAKIFCYVCEECRYYDGDLKNNGMITRFKAKGTQYCGTTAQDKNHMDNLFEVAFATRDSQSIMSGCTGYYNRFYATVVENNVERIIISKSDANNLVVGSTVSIGNATAIVLDDHLRYWIFGEEKPRYKWR